MAKIQNPTKVITGVNTRWSYANVWDAKSINGGAPKYSVSLIIPKSDTVTVNKIKAAIEAAYVSESTLQAIPLSAFFRNPVYAKGYHPTVYPVLCSDCEAPLSD